MPSEFVLDFNLRKILMLSIFLACAIFSTSCQKQNVSSFETNDETLIPREIPKDWQNIETDYFSFSIPPTMKKNDVRGIDSFVMQFEDNEITLDIEYGDYSADVVSQLQTYEGQKEKAVIDGKSVVIASFDYNKSIFSEGKMTNVASSKRNEKIEKNYFIGVNFPNTMKSFHESAISFAARYKNLSSQGTAKSILYSIKFKRQ